MGRRDTTFDEVVATAWERCRSRDGTAWTRGLGADKIRRRVVPAVARRRLGIPAPAVRGPDGRLDARDRFRAEEAADLLTWLCADGMAIVRELCAVARVLKDGTVARLRGDDVAVVPDVVAGRALTAVAAWYEEHGRCPEPSDLHDVVAADEARRTAEARLHRLFLDEPAFLAVAAPEWDRVWPDGRPPCRYPPAALGLGRDERPPLTGRAGNWLSGTDRPVYRRYTRCFDPRSRVPAPDVPPERHVTRRYAGGAAEAVVLAEVRRAAGPLGLAVPGHSAGLAAVADGLRSTLRAGAPGPDLDGWAADGPALPADPDPELVRAVTAHTIGWTANSRAAGVLDIGDGLRERVARRLRHRLHGREFEWDTPLRRPGFAAEVRKMFAAHLLEHDAPPDPSEPPGPPDGTPAAAADLTADENATFTVISADPRARELIRRMRDGEPGWVELYLDIVGTSTGMLTPERFHEFAHDLPAEPEGDR